MWGESRQRAVEFRADSSLCQRFRANQIPVNHRKQLSIKPKSLKNLLKHCTQRINKQVWQTLQCFKQMPFLVLTYLGVWGQRKTPDILQVTVIRTLCSDLNIKRELIWCKGRKQWLLVSCKGQPQGSYLFINTVSCHFHLTNILFVDLLPNKLLESCVIFFFKGQPAKLMFL